MRIDLFFVCGVMLVVLSHSSYGQALGAEVGFGMNSVAAKFADAETGNSIKPGFRAGISVDNYTEADLTWQYGLYYVAKGGFISFDREYLEQGNTIRQDFDGFLRVDYLELPVSLLYRSNYKNGGHFFTGGGPYFAAALGGLIGYENHELAQNQNLRSSSVLLPIWAGNNSKEHTVRVFDIGLQGQLGYEIRSGFFTRVSGGYGFMNISPSTAVKMKNLNFGLSVGYMLR